MNLRAKPPVFVPTRFRAEIEHMSKAALMDLVWDFAMSATHQDDAISADAIDDAIMTTLRERAEIVLMHRTAR